ncbi:hypothetical protein B0I35DRAFT_453716 [Stachybotrys elegans]|uniref:PAS domain-containing protein n=1 Tax=Stachybotrys elegans TaxID=80388 RepID=A0A8K0SCM9_9HYPO|nr:hypothetical protein B0I35DRAFT_453716 [Stachybotrys elegans]
MEKSFISIHTLDADADILFVSDSITDILGYLPRHVQSKSSFDYFHPDEMPLARFVHSRGILLDKAVVLLYTRIRSLDGEWVGCECCFTVVHDVLVACTTVYRQGERSETMEAPQVRRLFSSSSQDLGYHIVSHLSPKFEMPPAKREHRAALILNRLTRLLSIMFSTEAASSILGLTSEDMLGKRFYDCIQENCLGDAVKCLESAKANDSIAYLRFSFRDPRTEEDGDEDNGDVTTHDRGLEVQLVDPLAQDFPPGHDGLRQQNSRHSDSESGGVPLDSPMDVEQDIHIKVEEVESDRLGESPAGPSRNQRRTSRQTRPRRARYPVDPVGLEAVVSCASDELVVVLRRARQPLPSSHVPPSSINYPGLFAAPWARDSMLPQSQPTADSSNPQPVDHLMGSIRYIAAFAWGVVGANDSLVSYSHGCPTGEAQPFPGLSPWDSYIIQTPREEAGPRMAEHNEDSQKAVIKGS